MFTAKISVNNRKAFEDLKNHLEYLCQLNGATIAYDNDASDEGKEKKIKILYKKFRRRIRDTDYDLEQREMNKFSSYVVLWRKNVIRCGSCQKAPGDEYDERIAEILCYSRALGWKDIEQELLDVLY